MLDVGASELLMIVIVAIVVIGPKDMPLALRTAGRWIGKMRRISGHFRAGIDSMVREAELEEMERKWREQNEAIMKSHPQLPSTDDMAPHPTSAEAALASLDAPADTGQTSGSVSSGPVDLSKPLEPAEPRRESEPQLPLPPP